MPEFTVEFDRIGRHHNPPALVASAVDFDALAVQIHRHARSLLLSRDITVWLDDEGRRGGITAGVRDAGRFTITFIGAGPREPFPVTDDLLDAPDGATVDGYTRHGDTWHPTTEGDEDA